MRSSNRCSIALVLGLVSVSGSSPARAASVETFVLAIGGQAQVGPPPGFACSTGGPATLALSFFANVSQGVPADGLAPCGIAGAFRTQTAPGSGPIQDSLTLSTAFNVQPVNTAASAALSRARAGSTSAQASARFAGPSNSLIYEGSTSYGIAVDTLTPTSPSVASGTPGSVRLTFTVGGALSVSGSPTAGGTADVEINYQIDSGPSFVLMRAQASSANSLPFAISGTGAPLTGFVLTPGNFSGAGAVDSFNLAFVWGQPFTLKFGVLASAIPGSDATTSVDFGYGATLTGIQLFANAQPVHDFTISSQSGTQYGAQGVPEPGLEAVAMAGSIGLVAAGRKRAGRRAG